MSSLFAIKTAFNDLLVLDFSLSNLNKSGFSEFEPYVILCATETKK